MEPIFAAIIPKSPLPEEGRIGKPEERDWYNTCEVAEGLSRYHQCPIFISSAFESDGVKEADYYRVTLEKMGADNVIVRYEGMETIGHLDAIFNYAKKNNLKPIIVSTALHYPRVKFIAKRYGYPCEHRKAFGIPRPSEAKTDRILNFIFPIIHYAGLEKKFVAMTTGRRKEGKI